MATGKNTIRIRVLQVVLLLMAAVLGLSAATATEPPVSLTPPPPATQPAAKGTSVLPTGANVAIIKLEGLIYGYHFESLKQRVDQALSHGASLIVVELDTPGGLLESGLKISKYLRSISVPTVAWINPDAYSAGILIASACQRIVMAPISATGDCAPIVPGMNLSPTERAKALSPLLLEFSESAAQNGHEYVLFHAMCVLGIEVYQIKNPQTGQVRLVNQADYAVMVDGDSPDGGFLNKVLPDLSGQDDVASASVTVATDADRGQWELVKKIHDGKTLLTLSQKKAIEVGLADGLAKDTTELGQFLGAVQVKTWPPSTVALTAYWLNQPWMRAILIILLLIGGFIEMQSPGLGVGGLIALSALVVLLVAPFLVGLAQMWHVVLFFIGLVLLMAELFVIPGFGIAGASGIVCMFAGLVLMVVPTTGQGWMPMPAPEVARVLRESVLYTILSIVVSCIAFYFMAKHFGSIPVLNRMILHTTAPGSPGTGASNVAGGSGSFLGITQGALGQAVTDLRPSGTVEINNQIVDVVTLGDWIETGAKVRVVDIQGNRVVVDIA